MPELPEVETTLRGIAPHIEGKTVEAVILRQLKLRWQINPDLGGDFVRPAGFVLRQACQISDCPFPNGDFADSLGDVGQLADLYAVGRTYRQAGQTRSRRYCVFRRHGHALPRSEKVRRDTLV